MKYLVAGIWPGAGRRAPSRAPPPLQVVEKATRIRRKYKRDESHGKSRHEGCMIRLRKATGAKDGDFWAGELANDFSDLAQSMGNLLPGRRYPVKGLFGAAPQIARNSGAHPG